MMMRHPVERLAFHYTRGWTLRESDCALGRAVDLHSELLAHGRYAIQLKLYVDAFGFERILPVSLARPARHPEQEFVRVCRLLGHGARAPWSTDLERQNASSERRRRASWPDWLRRHGTVKATLRSVVPAWIRRAVDQPWRSARRPVLDSKRRKALEATFDEGPSVPGERFGVGLSCKECQDVVVGRTVEVVAASDRLGAVATPSKPQKPGAPSAPAGWYPAPRDRRRVD